MQRSRLFHTILTTFGLVSLFTIAFAGEQDFPVSSTAATASIPLSMAPSEQDGATAACRSGAPQEILTINQAVAIALKGNRDLRRQELDVERGGERVAASRTRLQPHIETVLLGSHQLSDTRIRIERGTLGDLPKLGLFPSSAITYEESRRDSLYSLISVSQPLSQRREIKTGIAMVSVARDLSREKTRQTRIELATQVRKTFCTLWSIAHAREANAAALELFHELVRLAERFVAEGAAQTYDLLETRARLAAVEARAQALALQEESMREQLNRLLGRPLEMPFQLAPLVEEQPALNELASGSLGQHPGIRQAALQVRMARLDSRLKQGEMRPQISLSVNHLTGHRTAEYLPRTMTSAGVLVTWEPFDWGRRRHELRDKRKAVAQAEEAAMSAQDAIQQAIHQAARRCQEAATALRAATEKLAWAREKARVIDNRLREQAALLREALEAQTHLAECEQECHQKTLDLRIATADLEQARGVEP